METQQSIYNEKTKEYKHIGEQFKVYQYKHCDLHRIANKCSIYKYTSGSCDTCAQNRKVPTLNKIYD
jgi:hypothetical protein